MKVEVKGVKIDDIQTDFAFLNFKDSSFILISQYKKPGCFIGAKKVGEGANAVYSLTSLMGEDEKYFPVARYIHEKLSLSKNTVYSIALKSEISKALLDALCSVLKEMKHGNK